MIIDLQKFIDEERKYWQELESILNKLEDDPFGKMKLKKVEHFHYLYQRTSADLARVKTFAAEQDIRLYLESLVARAYGEIHETRKKPYKLKPLHWMLSTFPRTFRSHLRLFWLSVIITLLGCLFGGVAVMIDPGAREIIMPFSHILQDPSTRVAREESVTEDRLKGVKARFSSYLMTHNTRVSINLLALGFTWGIGTMIMLFYNGIILGAVATDYVLDGQTVFLLGWLLPHGIIEIPAILIAGQGGLLIAQILIGKGDRTPLKLRFRKSAPDLVTLITGVAVLLVWAGIVEGFLSQYHEPFIPYEFKIAFGLAEFAALIWLLGISGKSNTEQQG